MHDADVSGLSKISGSYFSGHLRPPIASEDAGKCHVFADDLLSKSQGNMGYSGTEGGTEVGTDGTVGLLD